MSLILAINGTYKSYFSDDHPNRLGKVHHDSNHLNSKNKHAKSAYEKSSLKQKPHHLHLYARDIMTKDIRSVSPDTTLFDAWEILSKRKIHHLIVIEQQKVIGILSDRDLLRHIEDQSQKIHPIREYMQDKVILCKESTELKMIVKIMLEENISSLPVINDKNELVGMLTKTNILESVMNNLPLEIWG